MHKSNKGVSVDMDALRLKNEKTIAAGNMGINAKGDKLGRGGKIQQSAKDRTKPYYANNPNAVKQVSIKPDITEKDLANVEEVKKATKKDSKEPSKNSETILENGDIIVEKATPVKKEK